MAARVASAPAATFARTLIALAIAAAWTIPVGVAIGFNPTMGGTCAAAGADRRVGAGQHGVSDPAARAARCPGGLNIASVLLMLLGTQWYVLFNVIAGAMAVPSDLREAATVYHLGGWRRWRTLILPAIFPYSVTGMITATGGAWNASIVSEYVTFKGHNA